MAKLGKESGEIDNQSTTLVSFLFLLDVDQCEGVRGKGGLDPRLAGAAGKAGDHSQRVRNNQLASREQVHPWMLLPELAHLRQRER